MSKSDIDHVGHPSYDYSPRELEVLKLLRRLSPSRRAAYFRLMTALAKDHDGQLTARWLALPIGCDFAELLDAMH